MATVFVSPAPMVISRRTGLSPAWVASIVIVPGCTATGTPSRSAPSGAPSSVTAAPALGSARATTSLPIRRSSSAISAAAASRVRAYFGSVSARAVASRVVVAISS
jgi:hypothetical protein